MQSARSTTIDHQNATPEAWKGIWLWVAPCVIVAVAVAAYSNSFNCPFIFDDSEAIATNFYVRHLENPLVAMKAPPQTSVAGRPVVSLSLAINYALGGLDVRGYHAFNLAIHIGAGLLLFGVMRRTLRTPRLVARFGSQADGLGLVAALIWVVHPVQTESVTYIIQRAESLVGFFYLLTLYCAIRGIVSPGSMFWYLGAIIACAIGMATKEVMITAPVIVLLYDRTFVAGTMRAALKRRGLYAGLAMTWLVLGAIMLTAPRSQTAGFSTPDTPPLSYLATQAGVLVYYLKISFWPVNLCLDLGWPLVQSWREVVLPSLIILPLLCTTAWAVWRNLPVGFLGAWFFIILSPTSSFVPILDLAFEHRIYLSLAAVVALVVLGGYQLLHRVPSAARWGPVLAVLSILVLSAATFRRNHDYRSVYSIWEDVLAKRPGNVRAYLSLGMKNFEDGHVDRASEIFNQLIKQCPLVPEAHQSLATVLFAKGDLAGAERHYREAADRSPTYLQAFNNLGRVLVEQRRYEEAIASYEKALKIDPDYSEGHKNLGKAYSLIGKPDKAIEHYRHALTMRPEWPRVHNNLGNVLAQMGRLDEALAHFDEALKLQPDSAEAHNNRGIALARLERMDEAIGSFEGAVALRPRKAMFHVNLGNALLARKRSDEAAAQFREALKLDPNLGAAKSGLERATGLQVSPD